MRLGFRPTFPRHALQAAARNTSEFLSDSWMFLSQCSMSRLETRSIRVRRLARCGPGPILPDFVPRRYFRRNENERPIERSFYHAVIFYRHSKLDVPPTLIARAN